MEFLYILSERVLETVNFWSAFLLIYPPHPPKPSQRIVQYFWKCPILIDTYVILDYTTWISSRLSQISIKTESLAHLIKVHLQCPLWPEHIQLTSTGHNGGIPVFYLRLHASRPESCTGTQHKDVSTLVFLLSHLIWLKRGWKWPRCCQHWACRLWKNEGTRQSKGSRRNPTIWVKSSLLPLAEEWIKVISHCPN